MGAIRHDPWLPHGVVQGNVCRAIGVIRVIRVTCIRVIRGLFRLLGFIRVTCIGLLGLVGY